MFCTHGLNCVISGLFSSIMQHEYTVIAYNAFFIFIFRMYTILQIKYCKLCYLKYFFGFRNDFTKCKKFSF
jgi:hypothetical protein